MSTVKGGGNIVTDGLVFYVDAANPRSFISGSTKWGDLSKNQNVGYLTNGPTYNNSNGGSIVFDGVDDYINFGSSNDFNSIKTMEVWFYVTTLNTGVVVSRGESNFDMYIFNNGSVYTYWGNSYNVSTNNPTFDTNRWNHLTFVVSGSTEFIYKNGSYIGNRSLNPNPSYSNTGNVFVGLS